MDGVLRQSRVRQVEQHLAICSVCRHELEAYREMDQAVADEPTPEPSPGMAAEIVARALSSSPTGQPRRVPAWLEALTLSGVAFGLATTSVLLRCVSGALPRSDWVSVNSAGIGAGVIVLGVTAFAQIYYRKLP
jgi:anti-sigma factor RsiW